MCQKSCKKLIISRRLGERSPWNQHFVFVSRRVRKNEFGKLAWNHIFSEILRVFLSMKRSIGVFCVFLQVDFAKIEQNEDRVLRGVSQKTCKKLQKTPLFEEQKRWKTCHFGSFWTFIERKNFFILGRFLEISLEIFQFFSHFNYLRAHKLFFGGKIHIFLILGAGVRAEVQNHKN